MHKIVLYGINEITSALVQNGKYGRINTANTTTIG